MARLDRKLAALTTMPPAELRAAWAEAYDGPAPTLPPDLLRLGLGYRLQEARHGGLAKRLEAQLLSSELPAPAPPADLRPGTQLVREWNGRTIVVLVSEDGFLFEGQTYTSLSAIAKRVTGAHWSGPRFFGIGKRG